MRPVSTSHRVGVYYVVGGKAQAWRPTLRHDRRSRGQAGPGQEDRPHRECA